jgi:AraC-like DNA-binding protein
MDYLELPPPPPLDRLVRCFWFLRAGPGDEGTPQTIVPDGRAELVLHLGEPFAEADASGRLRSQAQTLLAGQLTGPMRLLPRPGADVVGIRLRSAGAGALIPMPLRDVTGRVAPLGEVTRRLEARLLDAAGAIGGRRERAQSLAHAIGRAILREPDPVVTAAVARLEAEPATSIGETAAALGTHPRTLQRRFLAEVGLAPGLLRRVLRFRTAFGLLGRLPPGRWATVAAATGYFDQAHLIREFRRFAGAAPTAFFRGNPHLARAFTAGAAE